MATRRAVSANTGYTPWGAVDWSHAPTARSGSMGRCVHCGRTAVMRHPISGKPCHKVCDDRYAQASGSTREMGNHFS